MNDKILGLLAVGFLAASGAAQATTVTYDFFVNGGDSGPLAGTTASGFFSFDDSIVPPGGGDVNKADVFLALAFTWNGIDYTETTANTGFLAFDGNGALTTGVFGTNCDAGSCSAGITDPNSWAIDFGPGGEFVYDVGGERLFFGSIVVSLRTVPEPGTLGLLGLSLGVLGLSRRRKAN